MGRPKEFDYENVLDAATETFWADGVARTSISSLVESMHIQRSSFYNSFASKERILGLVLERYVKANPLNILINARTEMEAKEPEHAAIDLILDFSYFLSQKGAGRGCLLLNGLSELTVKDGECYEIYQDYYVQLTGGLSVLLERLDREKSSDQGKSKLSLDHMMGILLGMSHYSKLDCTEQRLANMGLDLLSGLSPNFTDALVSEQERVHEDSKELMQA
ncbi:TetR/AcrR family transcriptional regulator [Cohaesibacter intestini]|uniref:TetR/AcrR family transcriptional regulator n=1 Tax=Cohaesibacter intestini TaxID=2211145 RepID=UPI000DEA7F01|nr:TetR/AcrR family transcriptional regulator [Cohaesibacter intestini]